MTKWSWRKQVESGQHPVTAVTLFAGALEYFQAARVLSASGQCSVIVVSQLGCHAIECGLKAFLLLRGKTDEDLRKIGHDLEWAWAECNQLGFSFETTRGAGSRTAELAVQVAPHVPILEKGYRLVVTNIRGFPAGDQRPIASGTEGEVGLDDYGKVL